MDMTDTSAPQGEEARFPDFLDRQFGLTANGTTVRTEFVAGVTTFLTMVYIVFVNPDILANAGMDRGAVFVATCLAAAISTLIMAFYANYPIALAPGMGFNAFFAFTLVLGYKYTWQQALAFVFLSGVLALIITATKLRETIINAIPQNLKLAVSAGVGLFLGIIALAAVRHRRRPSGDAGHARQSPGLAGDPGARRLRADRGAQFAERFWVAR